MAFTTSQKICLDLMFFVFFIIISKHSPLKFTFGSLDKPLNPDLEYVTLQLSSKMLLNNLFMDTFVESHEKKFNKTNLQYVSCKNVLQHHAVSTLCLALIWLRKGVTV